MVIKTEPVFTWFYFCSKTLRGQCPPVLPARDVGYSLRPTCGSPLLHSKFLCSEEGIQMANEHEKMLNISHYQRNANQNHNEVPSHASQDGCYQNVYKKITAGEGYGEKGILLHCWWECKLV